MKHIVGFVIALIVMVSMHLMNKYILRFEISEFFIGWISCIGYFAGKNAYEELN